VLIAAVLTAGMFSENWSAFRTRTGPRSRLSASAGVYFEPKSVPTSISIVPAVIFRSLIAVT
jgi:hypothetical protein